MARPTFTASDVARYAYCNLAWSYDLLGAPTLSPEEVDAKIAALRASATRSPAEDEELRYLERLSRAHVARGAGEQYHARVSYAARTVGDRTRRMFAVTFFAVVVLGSVALFTPPPMMLGLLALAVVVVAIVLWLAARK